MCQDGSAEFISASLTFGGVLLCQNTVQSIGNADKRRITRLVLSTGIKSTVSHARSAKSCPYCNLSEVIHAIKEFFSDSLRKLLAGLALRSIATSIKCITKAQEITSLRFRSKESLIK